MFAIFAFAVAMPVVFTMAFLDSTFAATPTLLAIGLLTAALQIGLNVRQKRA